MSIALFLRNIMACLILSSGSFAIHMHALIIPSIIPMFSYEEKGELFACSSIAEEASSILFLHIRTGGKCLYSLLMQQIFLVGDSHE